MMEAGRDEFASGETARLSASMSSRKLLALDFIKRYFARWGHSPTLGEIAAVLEVSTKRAHDLVHRLAAEKMIEVTAGKTRGIRLVDRAEELSEADVLARLSAMGWTIGDGSQVIQPPLGQAYPLTEKGLPELPILDHVRDSDCGGTGTSGDDKQD
jgi:hypothetical protein